MNGNIYKDSQEIRDKSDKELEAIVAWQRRNTDMIMFAEAALHELERRNKELSNAISHFYGYAHGEPNDG